jgi:hypothetical protein
MSTTAASLPYAQARHGATTRAGYGFIAVFLLVVLEGAIRKWGVESVTLPLILLRDAIAAYVILHALATGALRRQPEVTLLLVLWSCVVLAWGLLQVVGGVNSPTVLLIGLRFWLLYIWFAVAAAASMNEADYRAAMMVAIWTLILMAPLAVVQYLSPPGARINNQLEGDAEGVFQVVEGVVRTTGTFSFTLGYATYLALMAPLALAAVGARKRTQLQVVFGLLALGCFVIASVVSGSRTALIYSGLMLGVFFFGRFWLARGRAKATALVAVIFGLALVAVLLFAFSGAIDTANTRFQQASEAESFWGRILTIFVGEPFVYDKSTFLGFGLGAGSNLAGFVRTGKNVSDFALAEVEAGRILLEGGLIGYAFTALKVVVVVVGVAKSLRLAYKARSVYPILLWLTVALALLTWPASGQLTAHGLLGLMLAFGLLVFRFPAFELFPARGSST